MRKPLQMQWLLLVTTALLNLSLPVFAEQPPAKEPGRMTPEQMQRLEKMSPEERRAERERVREQWQQMSPEERATRREEIHQQWQKLPPEQREAIQQKLQQRRESMGVPGGKQGPGMRSYDPSRGEGKAGSGQNISPEDRAARREMLREHWQQMSPQERETMKQKFREREQNMSPEERAAKRQALRERWQHMSQEERQGMRRDFEGAGRGGPSGDALPRHEQP